MISKPIVMLADILQHLSELRSIEKNVAIRGLSMDSRKLATGELFLAVAGVHGDGRRFISQAYNQGAVAILAEAANAEQYITHLSDIPIPVIFVKDLTHKIGHLAKFYYQSTKAEAVKIIGVTGTNGKTSCCWLLSTLLSNLGRSCALLGTLGKGMPDDIEPTKNTTPDVLSVHQFIANLSDNGCPYLAMEVSSHGLDQGRVNAVPFDTGIFTNLSRDHLDSYSSMKEYAQAKSSLFSDMSLKCAVINNDDAYSNMMKRACPSSLNIITFSCKNKLSDVYASRVKLLADGFSAIIHSPWGKYDAHIPLMGRFNLENLLAVIAALGVQGYTSDHISPWLPYLTSAPGRMQRFGGGGKPWVFVDYAHTPDALHSALSALLEHGAKRLICVFGCGGDRDKGKRPLMASVALRGADIVVLTSDNPRSEVPEAIIADVMKGVDSSQKARFITIASRADAIDQAISTANASDIILCAGKGHETYQEIKGVKHFFDDSVHVRDALARWGEA